MCAGSGPPFFFFFAVLAKKYEMNYPYSCCREVEFLRNVDPWPVEVNGGYDGDESIRLYPRSCPIGHYPKFMTIESKGMH